MLNKNINFCQKNKFLQAHKDGTAVNKVCDLLHEYVFVLYRMFDRRTFSFTTVTL